MAVGERLVRLVHCRNNGPLDKWAFIGQLSGQSNGWLAQWAVPINSSASPLDAYSNCSTRHSRKTDKVSRGVGHAQDQSTRVCDPNWNQSMKPTISFQT